MARRGRERWSKRIIVDDCLTFDIANLVREGVFRAKPGTLCSTVWRNLDQQEIFRAHFWVELTTGGKTYLRVSYGVPGTRPLMHYSQNQIVEIVKTELHFGPRPWFLCPGISNNGPCRNRVRILYFPPNTRRLGCRECHNLIHRSAREHDKRIDRLLRLSPEELRRVVMSGTIRQQLLAVRASVILYNRLRKKLQKDVIGYPPEI